MLDHFKNIEKVQEVLHEAQTGLWVIELEEEKEPRMYADSVMIELLGLKGTLSPEECYKAWYNGIESEYYPIVHAAVEKITLDERAEVQYPWHHPEWGRLFVRCGGVRDWSYKNGVCLRGYHQNITNTITLKQEYDTIIQTLNENYMGILLCNLNDRICKMIKATDTFQTFVQPFFNTQSVFDYEEFFQNYIQTEVASQYKYLILDNTNLKHIKQKIAQGEKQIEILYQNKKGRWYRIRVVPLTGYSKEYPLVIIAFDEQDGEMEKRMDDATAKIAIAKIYKLVISINLEKAQYNCIYYSGELLNLWQHGTYKDFYNQMISKMPSEDKLEFNKIFQRENYKKNEYLEGVFRLYDKNRNPHYYSYYSTIIKENTEERILMTARNIDDKQEAQQRENVLSNLCKCYYSIYLFDLEHNIEEAIWQENIKEEQEQTSKNSLFSYYEKFIENYVFEEDKEKMRKAGNPKFLKQNLSVEQPVYDVDFRRIYADHLEWVRSRFSIAEIKDSQVTKVIFANMNINEQKIQELQEEQQKKLYFEYKNIIQGLSSFYHSVFYIDLSERTFQAFTLKEDILGYLKGSNSYDKLKQIYKEQLIYEKDQIRFDKELSIEEISMRICANETIYSLEYRRDYGSYYEWMRIHIILAESRRGIPAKVILAAHNIEEEKEQEEQNKKALFAAYEAAKNANEAKSSFLAQMSHDIRTPMNAIMGMSSIAASQVNDPKKVKDCLEKIQFSSRHLLNLINEILDMSKIEKGKIELIEEPFSIDELIQNINLIIRPEVLEKNQELQFKTIDILHDKLLGDINRIQQVLINLINNAVKYTPKYGKICVMVQEISIRTSESGCFVFTVEDNGIGMEKEFLNYIFVPFSRADDLQIRHIQGTGLGMSIAQGIVSAMQGNIQVESEKGKGSKFIVTLPLKIANQNQFIQTNSEYEIKDNNEIKEDEIKNALKGKRILLVEDNELNMEIAKTILQEAGLLIDEAENGQEALNNFLKSKLGTYQAILMDLQMPIMDGYTAAKQIRNSKHPQANCIPIIALTANAFTEDIAKALKAGMNDHVSKPINYNRLLAILDKNINSFSK